MQSEHTAVSAVQGWRNYPRTHQTPATPSKSIKPSAPMTVLSTPSTRTAVRPAQVLGISIFHGLIVAALSAGSHQPADHGASPTVAMIMVPVVKLAVPDQKPSPVIPATTIDTTPSDPPAEPAPMTEPAAPTPSTSVGAAAFPPAAISPAESPPAEISAAGSTPASKPTPSPGPSARPAIGDEIVPQVTRTASAPPTRPDAAARSHARPRLVEQHPPSSHDQARLVTASAKPTATYASPLAQSPAPTSAQAGSAASPQLTERIRNAVQEAVRCPAAARMMGQSGKAGVAFDYRAGAIAGRSQLARSSGTPVLDAAALTAVRMAHYPEAQPGDSNQLLHLLIWVEEACGG
jgi:TonB family protein